MTTRPYAYLQPGHYARGWHIVLLSQELASGEVQRLHYFDQDLVIYRGTSGKAAVLDAHCPHLGAHLASDGGRLLGDNIACPFHGWTFDASGRCVDIPYANKIPERAVSALRAGRSWKRMASSPSGMIPMTIQRKITCQTSKTGGPTVGVTGSFSAPASGRSPVT